MKRTWSSFLGGVVGLAVFATVSMSALAQELDTAAEEVVEDTPPPEAEPATDTGYAAVELPAEQPAPVPPPAPAPLPPAPASTPVPSPPAAMSEPVYPELVTGEPEEDEEEDDQPLSWFTVSPQVGYAFFPQAEMTYQGFTTTVSPRNGAIAKLHLDMGGDGIGFELAPLFGFQTGGIDNLGGSLGELNVDPSQASFLNVGGEMAIVYRFHLGYFYPHVGIGFHGSYVFGGDIEYGAQLYGRVPFGFSLYMGKSVALVVEAAFLFGATGIKQPFRAVVDPGQLEDLGIDSQTATDMTADLEDVQSASDLEAFRAKYQDQIDYLETQQTQTASGLDPDQLMQDAATNAVADAIRFGTGIGLELTVGLRFP